MYGFRLFIISYQDYVSKFNRSLTVQQKWRVSLPAVAGYLGLVFCLSHQKTIGLTFNYANEAVRFRQRNSRFFRFL